MNRLSGGSRGFALVLVLWVIALLTVVAGSFAFAMRTETELTGNLVARSQAEALAEGGLRVGVARLLEPEFAKRWRADGTRYDIEIAGQPVAVAVISERGKVDLNRATESLLRAVVMHAAEESGDELGEERLVDAILDWRDGNRNRRLTGAEDADYQAAGKPYGARDGPFVSVEELTQVLGMTTAVYRKLAPLVTVHGGRSRIDPGTAPRSVLLALPAVTEEQVDAYVNARDTAASNGIAPSVELLAGGTDLLSAASAPGTVTSGTFTVLATAKVGNAQATRAIVVRARATRSVSRRRNAARQLRLPYTVIAWTDRPHDKMAETTVSQAQQVQ